MSYHFLYLYIILKHWIMFTIFYLSVLEVWLENETFIKSHKQFHISSFYCRLMQSNFYVKNNNNKKLATLNTVSISLKLDVKKLNHVTTRAMDYIWQRNKILESFSLGAGSLSRRTARKLKSLLLGETRIEAQHH